MNRPKILHVAVLAARMAVLDYLSTESGSGTQPCIGARVRIPLGKRILAGIVVGITRHSAVPPDKLRSVVEVLDTTAVLPPETLSLIEWSATYYRHPLGDAMRNTLPKPLREGRPFAAHGRKIWLATEKARTLNTDALARAPRQAALLGRLLETPQGIEASALAAINPAWHAPLRQLQIKGLATFRDIPCLADSSPQSHSTVPLNADQARAVSECTSQLGGFAAILLEGVTGSGKTEVYLNVIKEALGRGHQCLVLVPEIGLTPQLLGRLVNRFEKSVALLHSGLSDRERHCAWYLAHQGTAKIIVGTRSSIFTPMPRLGLIVVDEEHDPSLKQHKGFHYHARDLAVLRAKQRGIPIILGSATPSLETLNNVAQGKYRQLTLPKRAGAALPPRIKIIDVRRTPMEDGLSEPMRREIGRHLTAEGQVLVFLNRRGYAPALICHACGWIAPCRRCDSHLTLHRQRDIMRCHHCEAESEVPLRCPECGDSDLRPLGQGTERVEEALRRWYPDSAIVRIDRDTVGRKGAIEARLHEIRRGNHQILVGTQMLSKGHDFPNVTLVCVLNVDQGLYNSDFRAAERLAQQVIQVSGRAGRADRPGTVLLQTHLPDHPIVQRLVRSDFHGFAREALDERRRAGLPPFRHLAVLRAEAHSRDAPMQFLADVRSRVPASKGSPGQTWGPIPAPMERRAGRFRAQLLFLAAERKGLQTLLDSIQPLERAAHASRVRWSLDVDPTDLF